jgi:CRP-like cAMP-binding protein
MTTRKKPYLGPPGGHRLFAACSRRELGMVARSCTSVARQAGAVFVREGQTSREFVLIVSGSVAVIRHGSPEVVLGSDEWFGDIELLSSGTSSATVIALTDVECIVMSRPEFTSLFDAVPSFRKRVVRSVASIARDSVALSKVPRNESTREELRVTTNGSRQQRGLAMAPRLIVAEEMPA